MTVAEFFMIWYHLIFSDNRKALGYAWNLLGFVAKLVQGVRLAPLSYSAPRLTSAIRSNFLICLTARPPCVHAIHSRERAAANAVGHPNRSRDVWVIQAHPGGERAAAEHLLGAA